MTSYIVIALFTLGIGLGWFFRKRDQARKKVDVAITWAVYLLLFLLGISVGTNQEIISNFSRIGYKAFWLTLGAVLGSVLVAKLVYQVYFKSDKPEEQ